ncbi:MAG TPA: Holliday junction branch migration protein RuvA [Bacteroidota bacterium]|nr:Holliday junction branch migration protein RuvA [Bacteroidota bacterium]
MISHLKGTIARKSPTELVIDVNGVGYSVNISLSTFESIGPASGEVRILTYMHVREDAIQLYGFATETERELFRLLISVSGIGPKMAQGILSGLNPSELKDAIAAGNIPVLTSISGVGMKTAERIVLELRNRLGKVDAGETAVVATSSQLKARSEAVIALMSLGYSRATAEKTLQQVARESDHGNITVEEMIKRALHHTAK